VSTPALSPDTPDTLAVLTAIDSVAQGRVLLYGSLPPHGRDVDLLIMPSDWTAVASRLRADGFDGGAREWVRFRRCSVCAVELIPSEKAHLPTSELRALFADAIPFEGLRNVVEPAPHHALLILARKRVRQRPPLAAKDRTRIERALAADPEAWAKASNRSELWGARRALARLQSLYRGKDAGGFDWRALIRRPHRTRVVALSGVRGEATSSQAAFLKKTLDRLGYRAVVAPARDLVGHGGSGTGVIWAAEAALSLWRPIWRQTGRGAIVIFDGYALDAAVALQGGRTKGSDLALGTRLLRIVSPSAARAYLLDYPERAGRRSVLSGDERRLVGFYRAQHAVFGARRLDASRRPEALCEEIGADVWRMLSRKATQNALIRHLRHVGDKIGRPRASLG
jgi:hypothetical protein